MRVAQISDIHADDSDSFDRLDKVIDWLEPLEPDALIVSGDLCDPPRRNTYIEVRERLLNLGCHIQVVPGNVDDRDLLRGVFHVDGISSSSGPFSSSYTLPGGLRLIGLDVTVPGAHHGDAGPILDWLERELDSNGAPALIFMHQHPFMCGIDNKDRNKCQNAEDLARVLERASDRVLGLTCGHVHRAMFTRFARLPATMCPSVTRANKLRIDGHEPTISDPPGLLVHHIEAGHFVTHMVPVIG